MGIIACEDINLKSGNIPGYRLGPMEWQNMLTWKQMVSFVGGNIASGKEDQ